MKKFLFPFAYDNSAMRWNSNCRAVPGEGGNKVISVFVCENRYVERIAEVTSGGETTACRDGEVIDWMRKIQEWKSKEFTLSHVPEEYRERVSKFLRRVIIARMAESPDLASSYHRKLREAYETEESLRDGGAGPAERLVGLLDEVEARLDRTAFLAGEDFTMADVMLVPLLARLALLNLEDEYIRTRPNLAEYWLLVRHRPSYKKVIGKHFDGWRKYKTLFRTWCFVRLRTMLGRF